MLSVEEIRKHLPTEYNDKPDEDIRAIRDNVQGLVELAFDVMNDQLKKEKEVFEKVAEMAGSQFKLGEDSHHGIQHWQTVKRIGLRLAAGTDADWRVITLFAALHDAKRESDGNDSDHGKRAAEYALELHQQGLLPVEDKQLEQLVYACRHHADRHAKSDDLTIQTCWDADRLDLYRLGEIPDEKYLYTPEAKKQSTRDFALKLLGK